MKKTEGFIRLTRPANVVTSVADVLAGVAISGYLNNNSHSTPALLPILLLGFSTIGLYGGGVVFNDVFDAELDTTERPERPIPTGTVTKTEATIFGAFLLIGGIFLACLVGYLSGVIAFMVALCALTYNKVGKHHNYFGPINMGLCRGFNLLLGISIVALALHATWYLAFIPVIYIAAITMISRGEVHGGSRSTLYGAVVLYVIVIAAILLFALLQGNEIFALLFLLPFAWMIFKPLATAIKQPVGPNIGKAVKAGVIALILMNAAWAAAFGVIYMAIIIVSLLPLSLKLGKLFAVT